MRISDWSSDVCSSDLLGHLGRLAGQLAVGGGIAVRRLVGEADADEARLPRLVQRRLRQRAARHGKAGKARRGQHGQAAANRHSSFHLDLQSVVEGKSVSVRLDTAGGRNIKTQKQLKK